MWREMWVLFAAAVLLLFGTAGQAGEIDQNVKRANWVAAAKLNTIAAANKMIKDTAVEAEAAPILEGIEQLAKEGIDQLQAGRLSQLSADSKEFGVFDWLRLGEGQKEDGTYDKAFFRYDVKDKETYAELRAGTEVWHAGRKPQIFHELVVRKAAQSEPALNLKTESAERDQGKEIKIWQLGRGKLAMKRTQPETTGWTRAVAKVKSFLGKEAVEPLKVVKTRHFLVNGKEMRNVSRREFKRALRRK